MRAGALGRGQARAQPVGGGQHLADLGIEPLAAVGVDPPLIARVR
jgi:hypothetical protein